MKIACIGAGPAGLYFALSMKLRDASHDVRVFERNARGVTFGWGVVFSDQTVDNLHANDPVSAARISDGFAHWDDIEVHIGGECHRSSGHGFIGIGRKHLLDLLSVRAEELGVVIAYDQECDPDPAAWTDYDLVIAADGINSRIRDFKPQAFGVEVDERANKFIWLGTPRQFDAFTFAFEQTDAGWIWAHAYRFAPDCSTFIVECAPATWTGLGFDTMDQAVGHRTVRRRSSLRYLGGQPLLSNAAHLRGAAAWLNFPPHPLRTMERRQNHPDRRCCPHRPFFDRIGHQAGARRCNQARRGAQSPGPADEPGARGISGRAQS